MSTHDYTIFVNSTDSFEDCWVPFFKLMSVYWPGCDQKIILNTETKDFSYPNLDIRCSRVAAPSSRKRLTWSECLIRCLDIIDSPLILYMQEDYFLNNMVNVEKINEFADLMLRKNYSCIRLMECDGAGPWRGTQHPDLWEVDQKARYRISLQAALWNKTALKRYVRAHEDPWQFEHYGSKRARKMPDSIYCVNREIFNDDCGQVVPYKPTGIVAGQWSPGVVVELFERHAIEVDYSIRGFHDSAAPPKRRSFGRRLYARMRSYI